MHEIRLEKVGYLIPCVWRLLAGRHTPLEAAFIDRQNANELGTRGIFYIFHLPDGEYKLWFATAWNRQVWYAIQIKDGAIHCHVRMEEAECKEWARRLLDE